MSRNLIQIVRSKDGCHSVTISKNYLYDDEAKCLAWMLQHSIDEHDEDAAKRRDEWYAKNGDLVVHDGLPVDYSINQTKHILATAEMRNKQEILIEGVWMILTRTDLKDDVHTSSSELYAGSQDDVRRRFIRRVGFGARVKRYAHGTFFSVVDQWSDG